MSEFLSKNVQVVFHRETINLKDTMLYHNLPVNVNEVLCMNLVGLLPS